MKELTNRLNHQSKNGVVGAFWRERPGFGLAQAGHRALEVGEAPFCAVIRPKEAVGHSKAYSSVSDILSF